MIAINGRFKYIIFLQNTSIWQRLATETLQIITIFIWEN